VAPKGPSEHKAEDRRGNFTEGSSKLMETRSPIVIQNILKYSFSRKRRNQEGPRRVEYERESESGRRTHRKGFNAATGVAAFHNYNETLS